MAARYPRTQSAPFHLFRRPPAIGSAPATDDHPVDRPRRRDRPRTLPTLPRHPYRGALLFAALMVVAVALTWWDASGALRAAGGVIDWLGLHNTVRGRSLATVLAAAAAALVLIGAWARETAEGRPVRLAGGRARMAVDEAAALLRQTLIAGAGLADASVRVQNLHRRGLRVTVRADVQPQARIDHTVDVVDELVGEIVQQRLGVRLAARPAVDVRYRELDLRWGRDT